jgi:hypothetical protein
MAPVLTVFNSILRMILVMFLKWLKNGEIAACFGW